MMNHGFELDINPNCRYRYDSIEGNWKRILQFPTIVDADQRVCQPTIEIAMSPSPYMTWMDVGLARIRRHYTPFSPGDIFGNTIPSDIWNTMREQIGRRRAELIAFWDFMSAVNWNEYETRLIGDNIENGVPFDYVRKFREDDNGPNETHLPRFLTHK